MYVENNVPQIYFPSNTSIVLKLMTLKLYWVLVYRDFPILFVQVIYISPGVCVRPPAVELSLNELSLNVIYVPKFNISLEMCDHNMDPY